MNNRDMRARIAQDTLAVLEAGFYRNQSGDVVSIADSLANAISGSVHYSASQLQSFVQRGGGLKLDTSFSVANETTLNAVRRLVMEDGHADVVCLNFASARNPGGGFLGGAEAQEENLAKSSGLYPCIQQMSAMYMANREQRSCVYLDDMIYSPRVPVFRDDDYRYLDEPYLASMITAPAANRSAIARNEPARLAELEQIMLTRIGLLLSLAIHHGHKTLVLGAWGCGVFGNEPGQMAQWFKTQLTSNPLYLGAFRHVHFAVWDKKGNGTYSAFADAFAGS